MGNTQCKECQARYEGFFNGFCMGINPFQWPKLYKLAAAEYATWKGKGMKTEGITFY